eukprot:scaffold2086_cov133-Isochrysis_galbana.AAC.3
MTYPTSGASTINNPLHPSQTTDLPGAPERDSATAESRQLLCCYSAIAAYIAAIGPGRASSGRDEWGLKPDTMRSGCAHVQQLTRPRPPLAPPRAMFPADLIQNYN